MNMTQSKVLFVSTLVGALSFLLQSGCSSSVFGTKAPNADTYQYRTFRWLEQSDVKALSLNDPDIDYLTKMVQINHRTDIEEQIRTRIEANLIKHGLKQSFKKTPDILVTFYAQDRSGEWSSSWDGRTPGVNGVPVVLFPNLDRTSIQGAERDDFEHPTDEDVYLVVYDTLAKKPAWTGAVRRTTIGKDASSPQFAQAIDELIDDFRKTS